MNELTLSFIPSTRLTVTAYLTAATGVSELSPWVMSVVFLLTQRVVLNE